MSASRTKPIVAIAILISLTSLSVSLWLFYRAGKTGFVDTIRLVNSYQLKTDMEKIEAGKLSAMRSRGDSLNAVYRLLQADPSADKLVLKSLETELMQLSSAFDQEYGRSNQEINEKVWKRLNPDIDEYARKNKMQLLIGANGMGTVLYGNPATDQTDELIQFVNAKYQNGH